MKKVIVALLILSVLVIPVIKNPTKIYTMGDPWDCMVTMINMNK